MGKFLSDFKKFAMQGNIIDLAVGVIIGGAFGKIVTSLVNDIIMPCISLAELCCRVWMQLSHLDCGKLVRRFYHRLSLGLP